MRTIKTLNQLKKTQAFIKSGVMALALIFILFQSKSMNAQDVGIFKISSPVSSCSNLSGAEKISVIVVNHGGTALDTIPVAYRIDTGAVVRDTIIGSLGSGDSLNFTFATSANLSARGLYRITAYTALPGDSNHSNDTAMTMVQSMRLLAGFSSNGLCQGSAISFTNTSTVDSGSLFYSWNFGDGLGTSTNTNPTYTYSKPGTYVVSLVVNSAFGCKDSITHTIKISTRPTAAFMAPATCIGSPTTFSDSSAVANDTIVSTVWSFGDGDSSTTQNPTHIYSTTGVYRAVLTVTTDSGCSAIATDSITVSPLPVASFIAPSKICSGTGVTFVDSSRGDNVTYMWSFGDTTVSTVASPTHTFSKAGKYLVKLTVTSKAGCSDIMTDSVIVRPNPKAAFSVSSVCFGDSARFTDMSTISDSSSLTYSWNFGDSSTVIYKSPAHLYAKTGTYTAKEIVTSNAGCADSVSQSVTVNPLPTGGFTTEMNNTLNVKFHANDTTVANTYMWDFGDGTSVDTGSAPTHTFSTQGEYRITLTVANGNHCSVVTSDTIDVVSSGFEQPVITSYGLDIYPNPFTDMTYITYNLNRSALVSLTVYNETGKLIRTMADGPQPAGAYQYTFNVQNTTPGLYFVKLAVDGNLTVKQIMNAK